VRAQCISACAMERKRRRRRRRSSGKAMCRTRGAERAGRSRPSPLGLVDRITPKKPCNAMCRIGLGGLDLDISSIPPPPPRAACCFCLPLVNCDWKETCVYRDHGGRSGESKTCAPRSIRELGTRPVPTAKLPARCAPGGAAGWRGQRRRIGRRLPGRPCEQHFKLLGSYREDACEEIWPPTNWANAIAILFDALSHEG
jgi:hypothetical protein